MKTTPVFQRFFSWLMTTELFLNPAKLLSGKWILYELYTEPADKLIHKAEDQINTENLFCEIEFTEDRFLMLKSNLTIPSLPNTLKGTWTRSKNFLKIGISDQDQPRMLEFQFAVEKENLKLLKKNRNGKIEVFGFFRRIR
jgi:hypothetical protein